MKLSQYRKSIDEKITTRDYIQGELDALNKQLKKAKRSLSRKDRALVFVEDVAVQTQMELSTTLEEGISAGLNSVFDTKYGFMADFKINRGRPECHMFFEKGGKYINPLEFSGLGAADVAAFAGRIFCLAMNGKYRKVLLLDEPFQRLKGEKENKRVIELMRSLSQHLKVQIICVNDERAAREDIIAGADRVFLIDQKGKKSNITVL